MVSKKAGYAPGQGRTFTPSLTGKWTEEFNQILESEGMSRNALTEELIEVGLKIKRNEHLFISTSNLTSEQIALLSSNEGQQILLNVALLLTGNSNQILMNSTNIKSQEPVLNRPTVHGDGNNEVAATIEQPVENIMGSQSGIAVNGTQEMPVLEISSEEHRDLIKGLPERLISGNETEQPKRAMTAQEKLKAKMAMLSQTKSDLKNN